jgi:hypothetical protein
LAIRTRAPAAGLPVGSVTVTLRPASGRSLASGSSVSSVRGKRAVSSGTNPLASSRTFHIPASGASILKAPPASVDALAAGSGSSLPASSSFASSTTEARGTRSTLMPATPLPPESTARPATGILAA